MGSRDKDPTTPHQPLLSSLVVRSSASDGGGGGGGRVAGSDYEPGEVHRDPPPYSRSDRRNDEPGYRNRAGSSSPARRRDADNRHVSDPDRLGGPFRSRDFGNGRDSRRHRDNSPPYSRGPGGGRPAGRGFDAPGFGPGPSRGEGVGRNNPNVQPREGDWYCTDPLCGNLNFARRENCNHCRRSRYAPVISPRRGYPGPPPPHAPPRRFPGPPMDLSPGREMNGFRSPPRGWARDGPRDFGAAAPPPRHEGRFSHHGMRRDRMGFPDDEYRGRNKFDRPIPLDMGHRDRGRGNFFNDRKGYERRPPSPPLPPPLPPQRGRWGREARERSRSPIRGGMGGPPPPKDYRYMGRGRDDRRGMGRDRIGDAY